MVALMCITNETKAFYSNQNALFCIEIFTCQFYFSFTLEFSSLCLQLHVNPAKVTPPLKAIFPFIGSYISHM